MGNRQKQINVRPILNFKNLLAISAIFEIHPQARLPTYAVPYSTMYVCSGLGRYGNIAGFFYSREEFKSFYRKKPRRRPEGTFSVSFDLATHPGYDSDHPRSSGWTFRKKARRKPSISVRGYENPFF